MQFDCSLASVIVAAIWIDIQCAVILETDVMVIFSFAYGINEPLAWPPDFHCFKPTRSAYTFQELFIFCSRFDSFSCKFMYVNRGDDNSDIVHSKNCSYCFKWLTTCKCNNRYQNKLCSVTPRTPYHKLKIEFSNHLWTSIVLRCFPAKR